MKSARPPGGMDTAADFPSLMDDAEFLSELEKIEGASPSRAADRASRVAIATKFDQAVRPMPSASTRPLPMTNSEPAVAETVLPRDVDRWQMADPAPDTRKSYAAIIPAFVMILAGLAAGAAGSAFVFRDRIGWLLHLWSR